MGYFFRVFTVPNGGSVTFLCFCLFLLFLLGINACSCFIWGKAGAREISRRSAETAISRSPFSPGETEAWGGEVLIQGLAGLRWCTRGPPLTSWLISRPQGSDRLMVTSHWSCPLLDEKKSSLKAIAEDAVGGGKEAPLPS